MSVRKIIVASALAIAGAAVTIPAGDRFIADPAPPRAAARAMLPRKYLSKRKRTVSGGWNLSGMRAGRQARMRSCQC